MEIVLAIFIVTVLIVGSITRLVKCYNDIIFLNNNVQKSYANIDVLLKQRVDEIPNLVTVIKEYINYEQQTLIKLTQLRTDFLNATKNEDKIELANQMQNSLKSVFALSENYPQLQANHSFINLQNRVSEIENSLADRREFYNEAVALYNTGIQEFPNILISKIANYKPQTMLLITESEKAYSGVKF